MSKTLEAQRWDETYQAGRYEGEPPLPFVEKIIDHLGDEGRSRFGIYVGCGNGRNYIRLSEAGLNITGVDISPVSIAQLIERYPAAENKVMVRDFNDMPSARVWEYIVSIQTFQLGDQQATEALFARAHAALRVGGLLFLRINASDTEIYHAHKVIEGRAKGTRTVLYEDGPKAGLAVRFFSRQALGKIAAQTGFDVIEAPKKVRHERAAPKTGTWAQWETIWQKPA